MMTVASDTLIPRNSGSLTAATALLALVALAFASTVEAAGKGGKGGGGSGGPQPELHHQWRVKLNAPYSRVRPAVADDGTIYAVDLYDNLTAVAPDGTVLWTVAEAGSKGVDVGPDGTVYTGNENWIKAFNPDGSLKWTFTQSPRAFVFIDVAVGPDGNIYGVASSGMGVFSLADTGSAPELRWTNPEAYNRTFVGYTEIEFGPTADGGDYQLYFYANAHTRAVRLSDGASVFSMGGGNTRPRVSPLDGTWHRPDSAYTPDGDLVWFFDFPVVAGSSEPVLGADGTHYAVNWGTDLYAIDPDGFERWSAPVSEWVGMPDISPTEPILVLDTLGTQTHPPALLAASATNGSQLWRMEFPPDETGLSHIIDGGVAFSPDGLTGYVMTAVSATNNTYLNAIDLDPGLPSASTVLRSADIWLDARSRRGSVNFTGNVTVLDQNKGAISGATVAATWTQPDGSSLQQTTTTSGTGVAKFSISGEGGLYRLEVTDIAKSGYAFDPQRSLLSAARAWY